MSQFIQVDRSDIPPEIEARTNWINPTAIAMVTKQQRGNNLHLTIVWMSGRTTKIADKAAHLFLERWEAYLNATSQF